MPLYNPPAPPLAYPPSTAGWSQPPDGLVTSGAAALNVTGNCCWVPITLVGGVPYNGIGLIVATAVAGGTAPVVRLGLYADDGTGGKPGALLVDAGTVTITATGNQFAAFTSQTFAGKYWMSALYTHTAAPSTALSVQQVAAGVALAGNTWSNSYRGWLLSGAAAGSMPAIGAANPSTTLMVTLGLRRG